MVTESELRAAVDAAFAITGRGLHQWPDPNPDRSPPEEAYSRLVDPEKWRIVGARADAWIHALVDAGLAVVEHDASVSWGAVPPYTEITRADNVVPRAPGALALVVARSRLGGVDDAGVTLGVGDPAECLVCIPDCGCDACDGGSQDELDVVDDHVASVVSGTVRRLTDGARTITVIGDGRSASGDFGRREVDAILADPRGWRELSGTSWLDLV